MDSYNEDYDYQKLLKIAPQLKQLEPKSPEGFSSAHSLIKFITKIKKETAPKNIPAKIAVFKYFLANLSIFSLVINSLNS